MNTKTVTPTTKIFRTRRNSDSKRSCVFRKAALKADFNKNISNGYVSKNVALIHSPKDTAQIAYVGDIVLTCSGDPTDPNDYRMSEVIESQGVVSLSPLSLDINLVMAVCNSEELNVYFSKSQWVPSKSFLLNGRTLTEHREMKKELRIKMAKKKKAVCA